MALIIEDGTIVEGAMSYVTVKELREYADARGQNLPEEEAECEHLLVRATDFIDTFGNFQGVPVAPAIQDLQWPRVDVWVNHRRLDSAIIPRMLKRAVCEAAVMAQDITFNESSTAPVISSETIGPINTQYAVSASNPWQGPSYPSIHSALAPLLGRSNFNIEVVRV